MAGTITSTEHTIIQTSKKGTIYVEKKYIELLSRMNSTVGQTLRKELVEVKVSGEVLNEQERSEVANWIFNSTEIPAFLQADMEGEGDK